MARYRKPGKGQRKQAAPKAPLIGCVLIIVLALVFLTWALSGVLQPN